MAKGGGREMGWDERTENLNARADSICCEGISSSWNV